MDGAPLCVYVYVYVYVLICVCAYSSGFSCSHSPLALSCLILASMACLRTVMCIQVYVYLYVYVCMCIHITV